MGKVYLNLNLLSKPEVIRWCYEGITDVSLRNTSDETKLKESNKIERDWGNKIISGKDGGGQWTTR